MTDLVLHQVELRAPAFELALLQSEIAEALVA